MEDGWDWRQRKMEVENDGGSFRFVVLFRVKHESKVFFVLESIRR